MATLVTRQILKLIRFRYEYFGEEILNLASDYDVPAAILDRAQMEENWTRQNLPISLTPATTATDLEGLAEEMLATTKVKCSLINALNQQILNPKYLEAEYALVTKLIEVVNRLSSTADNAGTQIKAAVGALKDLQERQQVMSILGSSKDGSTPDGKLVVQIVNQVSG